MKGMIKVRGTERPTALVECLNIIDNTFAVRYFVEPISVTATEDSPAFEGYEWLEVHLNYCPSPDDCFRIINEYLEAEEERIMDAGFEWTSPRTGEKYLVSLDKKNRDNYAKQYVGNTQAEYPLRVSPYFFGLHSEVMYLFETLDELNHWYKRCLAFGAKVNGETIAKRSRVNLDEYNIHTNNNESK